MDQYIKVTVSSELTADDNEDSNFLLQLSILGRSWKVSE